MINCNEISLLCYTNAICSWFDTKSLIPWSFRLGVGDNPFPRYNNITFQIINSDFHICETRHVYLSSEIWAMNFLSILWLLLMAEIWYLAPVSPSSVSYTNISSDVINGSSDDAGLATGSGCKHGWNLGMLMGQHFCFVLSNSTL